ncbi:MAG: OadG family protein [Kiritimatiellae bacterium]|nr:OadG family protein [Kiritimatiellia bacterium]
MAVLGQGLVLMIAGMGIVYVFLSLLILVTKFSMKGIGKFDSVFPQEAPKRKPAGAAGDDADIALAIAVALG